MIMGFLSDAANDDRVSTLLLLVTLFGTSLVAPGSVTTSISRLLGVPLGLSAAITEPALTKILPATLVVWLVRERQLGDFGLLENNSRAAGYVGGVTFGFAEASLNVYQGEATFTQVELYPSVFLHGATGLIIASAFFREKDTPWPTTKEVAGVYVVAMLLHLGWNLAVLLS